MSEPTISDEVRAVLYGNIAAFDKPNHNKRIYPKDVDIECCFKGTIPAASNLVSITNPKDGDIYCVENGIDSKTYIYLKDEWRELGKEKLNENV